jgi:hypothetical protein
MNVGIVVYSWSGNTLTVCEKLKEKLAANGHSVVLAELQLEGERARGSREFKLGKLPDLTPFDGLVFGAAVEAFSLSPVLTEYLGRVETLRGTKVGCLVTQQFPYAWLGGNRAIRQMKRLCRAKEANVVGSAVVNWAQSRRAQTVREAVDGLAALF